MRYSVAIAAAVMASAAVASPVPQPDVHYEYKTVNTYTTVTQMAEAKVVTETAPVVTQIAATVTQTAPMVTITQGSENKKQYNWNNQVNKGWTSRWTYTYGANPSPAPVQEVETKTYEVKPTISTPPPAATSHEAAPKPSATQSGDSYNTGNSFDDECLKSHNDDRAKHGAAPLTWNTTMAEFALDKVSKTCVFEHSGGPYGENLAMGYKTAAEAIAAWYDEEKMYDYASGQFSSATGHFTQMVWKSAKQMGCGSYECPGKGNFLTCNYDTGNVISQFVENVLPPTSSSY